MGKRVFVLGGAGAVGSECSRDLLAAPDIEQVTIGEANVARARELAQELGDDRVMVQEVDVHDVVATSRAVEGHDVLMNTLFWGAFDDALAVACTAGINYADLLSFVTDRHREMASNAGITAISGLGASPGIGNVLARKACEHLDEPVTLEISCTSFRTLAPSPGLLDTILSMISPDCPPRGYHLLGRFVPTGPLEGSKNVDFGPLVGVQTVYFIAHSEVTTFPRHFPTLQFVAVRGAWRPEVMEDVRVLGSYGLLDDTDQMTESGPVNVRGFTRDRLWATRGGRVDDGSYHLFLHIEVTGRSNGQSGRVVQLLTHPLSWRENAIGRMTGTGASVGAILLARAGTKTTGIVDPEEYFDPDEFMAELLSRPGLEFQEAATWESA